MATLLWFTPVITLVLTALKDAGDFAVNGAFSLPKSIRWANFSEAWETGVKNYFWNSVIVTGFKVPIGIVLESMAAFALTHMHFKWADRVFTYILIGLIVPMQMTLVPLTLLMNALNLIDTLTGLTILYIGFGVPFGVLVMRGFFRTRPHGYHRGGTDRRLFLVSHFLPHCFAFGAAGGRFALHSRRRRYLERVYLGPDLSALGRVTDSCPLDLFSSAPSFPRSTTNLPPPF